MEFYWHLDFVKLIIGDKPGWPELAFPTTSTARVRMVAMATPSAALDVKLDMEFKLRGKSGLKFTNHIVHYLSNPSQAEPGQHRTNTPPRIQMHPQLSDKKLGYFIHL